MTPQENEALTTLLNQLTQVRGLSKDPQADSLIREAAAQQPDAVYLLVQRTMLLDQALSAAKQQAASLQTQLDEARKAGGSTATAPASGGSFLDVNAWGNAASTRPAPDAGVPSQQGSQGWREPEQEMSVTGRPLGTVSSQGNGSMQGGPNSNGQWGGQFQGAQQAGVNGAAMNTAPQRSSFLGGGAGGMLGTMAATAAGVAGGAFLFQGIGSLLGNHHPAASMADSVDKGPGHENATASNSNGSGGSDAGKHESADTSHGQDDQQSLADTSGSDYTENASWDDLSGVDSGLSGFDDDSSVI